MIQTKALPIPTPAMMKQTSMLQYQWLDLEQHEPTLKIQGGVSSADFSAYTSDPESINLTVHTEQHRDGALSRHHDEGPPALLAINRVPSTAMEGGGTEWEEGERACFVCMDAGADAVLLECGHSGLCAGEPLFPPPASSAQQAAPPTVPAPLAHPDLSSRACLPGSWHVAGTCASPAHVSSWGPPPCSRPPSRSSRARAHPDHFSRACLPASWRAARAAPARPPPSPAGPAPPQSA
jgi:hypothetical protein